MKVRQRCIHGAVAGVAMRRSGKLAPSDKILCLVRGGAAAMWQCAAGEMRQFCQSECNLAREHPPSAARTELIDNMIAL